MKEDLIMGYFSELNIEMKENRTDRSYFAYDEQLLSRYEDLKYRYAELKELGAPTVSDDYFSKSDCLYAPLDCFNSLRDVRFALETIKEYLQANCDVTLEDDGDECDEDERDADPNQITLFEIVLMPSWLESAAA